MGISRRGLLRGSDATLVGGGLAVAGLRGAGRAAAAPVSLQAALAASASPTLPVTSRNSVFTRSGPGPLYWTPYSWTLAHGTLTESVWQQNIDWVAGNFASYGYTMCCTDGWVDYTQKTNGNGYVLSYSDSWTHDWAYWADYLSGKGLKLGVYYNPLWVTTSAVNDPTKTVVGTDIPVSSIVTSGDWFNSNHQEYWVDVTKPGAKEFVQGYVNYFKSLGVAYLRTDFWAWYESGWDQNAGTVGVAHGSTNYTTALQWISGLRRQTGSRRSRREGDLRRPRRHCGQLQHLLPLCERDRRRLDPDRRSAGRRPHHDQRPRDRLVPEPGQQLGHLGHRQRLHRPGCGHQPDHRGPHRGGQRRRQP
ncbi:hypothetical protein ABH932_007022 [Streptacidiphilus sp. MAP5-52]